MKSYTIGEIYRLGLLKSRKGKAYSTKAAVSRAVRGLKKEKVQTAHGVAYAIPASEITRFNKREV